MLVFTIGVAVAIAVIDQELCNTAQIVLIDSLRSTAYDKVVLFTFYIKINAITDARNYIFHVTLFTILLTLM